jgi:hypothetical protein
LCKKYSLFSALAHIFNRALDDFVAPAEALLQAAAVDAAAVTASGSGGGMGVGGAATARKLLLYLRESIRGKSFPPGRV